MIWECTTLLCSISSGMLGITLGVVICFVIVPFITRLFK